MTDNANYDINFFKPRTPFLRDNIRVIVVSLVVWAVFVYGFQILLRVIEKPTPQPAHATFQEVYPKVQDGTASPEEIKALANVYLAMVSKVTNLQTVPLLKTAFTATAYQLLPADQQSALLTAAANPAPSSRDDLSFLIDALGVEDDVVLKALVPFALAPIQGEPAELSNDALPGIMDKYLIHNQSFLTNARVLGFPLPYLYSAVFLLILFNLICLIYCYVIDGIMKKHGLESADE